MGWLIGLGLALVMACIAVVLLVQPPRRWQEPLMELNRNQVQTLLGTPDADFSPKGWDGWDKPVVIGAWVLTVNYDEAGRVIAVRKKFDWGLSYLFWDRDYSKRFQKDNGAVPRE